MTTDPQNNTKEPTEKVPEASPQQLASPEPGALESEQCAESFLALSELYDSTRGVKIRSTPEPGQLPRSEYATSTSTACPSNSSDVTVALAAEKNDPETVQIPTSEYATSTSTMAPSKSEDTIAVPTEKEEAESDKIELPKKLHGQKLVRYLDRKASQL